MSDLFWDVDTQVDFMNEDGQLFVEGAEDIKSNLKALTNLAKNENIPVAGSLDTHRYGDGMVNCRMILIFKKLFRLIVLRTRRVI